MTDSQRPGTAGDAPFGAHVVSGIVHRRSQFSVTETVERLTEALDDAGANVFALIDQSAEADRAGLSLRDTKLLIFGNPAAGTPVMEAAPTAALDLPLKALIWADDRGEVWITYLSAEWLADRHNIPAETAKALSAVEALTSRLTVSS